MAFYESVFIIRQDISSADVDRIIDDFTKTANECNIKVIKTEYWGLRTLAYEIKNNKKGHYVLFAFETPSTNLDEFKKKIKYNENIIRSMTIRVEKISTDPSPILRGKNFENEEVVDVTVTRE